MKNPSLGAISLLKILVLIILSWILIHVFALLGIYLAIAYPIWWFFAPYQTMCLWCRFKQDGQWCPLCKQAVQKASGLYPRTFRSVLLSSFMIIMFSIFSLGVVFVESQILARLGFPATTKTASFIIPSKGQYRLGEIFPMKIEVTGFKTPINAVQTDLSFNPNKLELIDVRTEGSFATLFLQKEINNEAGYARLTGGLPNPGYLGDRGLFGTAYFKGKVAGLATVEFLPSSLVLANDSQGSNILKDYAKISYLILPEAISQDEATQQQQLLMDEDVLGVTSDPNQLIFFDQTTVLGVTDQQPVSTELHLKTQQTWLETAGKWLNSVDTLILLQLQSILHLTHNGLANYF